MKELLLSITKKDFSITWFSGKGAGGQHRNKHQNCCRLLHKASGTVTVGQTSKSRKENLRVAFKRMTNDRTFKYWLNKQIWETIGKKTIEEKVKESMKPENLKIEGKDESGKWSTESVRLSA